MGEAVNELVNLLLISARDRQGAFHSHALVMDLLGRAEQILNDGLSLVLVTTPITLTPYQCFYSFQTYLPETISVLGVRHQGEDLDRLKDLNDLASIDRSWHRRVATKPECYLQLGETYLILWPGSLDPATTVDVISTRLTPLHASLPLDTTTIAHENSPALMDLTRAFLNLRARQFDALARDLQSLASWLALRDTG